MHLPEPQLGGVFARDDPLIAGDEPGQHVEERGLSRAGATRDQNVQTRPHGRVEVAHDRGRRAARADDLLRAQDLATELSNREAWTVNRHRLGSHGDPGAVLEPTPTPLLYGF